MIGWRVVQCKATGEGSDCATSNCGPLYNGAERSYMYRVGLGRLRITLE